MSKLYAKTKRQVEHFQTQYSVPKFDSHMFCLSLICGRTQVDNQFKINVGGLTHGWHWPHSQYRWYYRWSMWVVLHLWGHWQDTWRRRSVETSSPAELRPWQQRHVHAAWDSYEAEEDTWELTIGHTPWTSRQVLDRPICPNKATDSLVSNTDSV